MRRRFALPPIVVITAALWAATATSAAATTSAPSAASGSPDSDTPSTAVRPSGSSNETLIEHYTP
ncbi:MAG: hypothetical protein M3065_19140 [Actinomycetota bacterium]|nr:hypothetical protein [Actinomycetota bacterium]